MIKKILNLFLILVIITNLFGVSLIVMSYDEAPIIDNSTTTNNDSIIKTPTVVSKPTSLKINITTKMKTSTKIANIITEKTSNKINKTTYLDKSEAKKIIKKAKIKKLKVVSRDNKIVANWKIVKKAKGYQIQLSKSKKFKKIIKNTNIGTKNKFGNNKIGIMINKKLPTNKSYYIRIRPYCKYKNNKGIIKKAYGKWKNSNKININENTIRYWNRTDSTGITNYVDEEKNQVWSTDGFFSTYTYILAEYGITRTYTRVKVG